MDVEVRYNSYRCIMIYREVTENYGTLYLSEYLCILFAIYM